MSLSETALVLVTAHLLGDFVSFGRELETWNRRPRSWSSTALHAAIHGGLVLLILGTFDPWLMAAAVAASHFLIDALLDRFGRPTFVGFLWDQIGHLAISGLLLAIIPVRVPGIWQPLLGSLYGQLLALIAGGLAAVLLGGEVIGWLVRPFAQQLPEREDRPAASRADRSDEPARGFPQGGRTIGYLERALIFLLVLVGQAGAVGFLVAAKSVFRFGELRERSNRVEAEYILIGTLASFLWGLAVAHLTTLLLGHP